MGGVDGFQACREIKRRFTPPFLPVLLLTALDDREHRNLGFESGCDDFIAKPVDRRELQLRVRAFLRIRHQEDLIRAQLDELQRLDRLKDDLAALIVHDLRNPLAGLSGFLHIMQSEAGGGAQGELVSDAIMAMRNLRDTVEDMLKVRRLEEAQVRLERQGCGLRQLAAQAADSLRGAARERGVALEVDGDDVPVDVDLTLVRRAIENLVSNALRYTRSGGDVVVSTRRQGADAVIDVADRGPGIPEALRDVLFQKYGSVEARAGLARRGNGLGLYLVRLTAEVHGGHVAALDRDGGGTIFRITLPAS
jgi:two-component system sensor histidine kinase/response regulator